MRHMYLLSLVLLFALMGNTMAPTCAPGYASKKRKCIDEDECTTYPNICGKNATCFNTIGSYYCQCHKGFAPAAVNFTQADGITCEDINECGEESVCGVNAECKNTEGGFYCTCKTGFSSSSGNKIFQAGKGVQCIEFNCDAFTKENKAFQANLHLAKLVSLMNSSCWEVHKSVTQVDGEKFLQRFLEMLDGLLRGGFRNNKEVSAMFDVVESMLKMIGFLLSKSQTTRSSNETEVVLLKKKDISPPKGELFMSTKDTEFTTQWDTATGKTYFGFTTASLLGYKNLEKQPNGFFNHLEQEKQRFKLNSKVVTITVSNTETDQLEKPVTLKFSHLESSTKNHTCVFWDHKLDGGAWSTRDCKKLNSSQSETFCFCSHLSSFAVLMALYDIGDVYELNVITWVGLSLSLVCLFICILTFHFVRSIQSTRNTIHLHLCISLFIGYFVFLVGIARTENKVGCSVVAGVLHYFFLASFCWMCLEGVQLFRMVVLVFNTTLRHIYMMAVGYGLPAVIVAVSAAANAGGYGTDRHCWLNFEDGSIWSFYGPVCAIIIVNVFFFLVTIWKLAEKFSSLNPDLDNLRKIKAFTVTAIAQLCVLGIMWVFGCFQFNENTLVMSYIFTILSCLQGVLMFVMHCWLCKQVRDEYAKFLSCICTPQKRKYSEFSSNQTSKSQGSKSVQNTGESHI